ncbi:T9SS type A sorting domain-containing protein [Bacteroidota bacterium]
MMSGRLIIFSVQVRIILRIHIFILLSTLFHLNALNAQVVLNADGPGDTYELINSVLAPGYNVVEVPDCAHPEFGRHIEEVYDSVLGKYVFKFHIHVTPDNDRCKVFDRQRNEIKTYDKSPDNLKAVAGETVLYKWRFKIDTGFQSSSSFTHLHQLKAVGGPEESMPLITLTARKGSPDKMQIRYAQILSQTTIHEVPLDPFMGSWVEVEELVTFGESGKYYLNINRISDSSNLMAFSHDNIRMWKTDARFLRPKWGIYRSLNASADLRDEMVLFSDFYIEELDITSLDSHSAYSGTLHIYPNPARDYIQFNSFSVTTPSSITIIDQIGRIMLNQTYEEGRQYNISALDKGIYFVRLYSGNETIATSKFVKQ